MQFNKAWSRFNSAAIISAVASLSVRIINSSIKVKSIFLGESGCAWILEQGSRVVKI